MLRFTHRIIPEDQTPSGTGGNLRHAVYDAMRRTEVAWCKCWEDAEGLVGALNQWAPDAIPERLSNGGISDDEIRSAIATKKIANIYNRLCRTLDDEVRIFERVQRAVPSLSLEDWHALLGF